MVYNYISTHFYATCLVLYARYKVNLNTLIFWVFFIVLLHGYRRQSLVRGIRLNVYPRKKVIHVFRTPFVVQEH
jgi:hypothetical protein